MLITQEIVSQQLVVVITAATAHEIAEVADYGVAGPFYKVIVHRDVVTGEVLALPCTGITDTGVILDDAQ